mmetsp:Transcript_1304/g.2834  ORF Transcript_1304/g.2834 Transcript_1304/m.2834 type:complete len:210 (-) Transcript_1304:21-650(-)
MPKTGTGASSMNTIFTGVLDTEILGIERIPRVEFTQAVHGPFRVAAVIIIVVRRGGSVRSRSGTTTVRYYAIRCRHITTTTPLSLPSSTLHLPRSNGYGGCIVLHITRTQRIQMSQFKPRRSSGEETSIFRRYPHDEHRHGSSRRSALERGRDELDRLTPIRIQELHRPLPPLEGERTTFRLLVGDGIGLRESMEEGILPTGAHDHPRK